MVPMSLQFKAFVLRRKMDLRVTVACHALGLACSRAEMVSVRERKRGTPLWCGGSWGGGGVDYVSK